MRNIILLMIIAIQCTSIWYSHRMVKIGLDARKVMVTSAWNTTVEISAIDTAAGDSVCWRENHVMHFGTGKTSIDCAAAVIKSWQVESAEKEKLDSNRAPLDINTQPWNHFRSGT